MAKLGHKEGVFKEGESQILVNLMKFNSIRAKDIMTPRTVIVACDESKPLKTIKEVDKFVNFSRIPVYKDRLDYITGFILRREVLSEMLAGNGDKLLSVIKRDILSVKEDEPLPKVFETLMKNQQHIAIVTDEYGGTQGVVTVEDVVETLLGLEIVDEFDRNHDMQVLAREQWKSRAARLKIISEGTLPADTSTKATEHIAVRDANKL